MFRPQMNNIRHFCPLCLQSIKHASRHDKKSEPTAHSLQARILFLKRFDDISQTGQDEHIPTPECSCVMVASIVQS